MTAEPESGAPAASNPDSAVETNAELAGDLRLLAGRRGLILGVANERSIAWGIARRLSDQGAELSFTYQGEALGNRVRPLAGRVGSNLVMPADVLDDAALDSVFERLGSAWGTLDFVVHAIAYAEREDLADGIVNTSRSNFRTCLEVSCFSLIDISRRASALMPSGGSIITLTFQGSRSVMPNYNVMGVAKAALEGAVRYLANELGPRGIRVNAISPGPMRTLSGAAIGGARRIFRTAESNAPLRSNASLADIGGAAVFLVSDLGAGTTGEIVHVDGGYHVLGMPQPENL